MFSHFQNYNSNINVQIASLYKMTQQEVQSQLSHIRDSFCDDFGLPDIGLDAEIVKQRPEELSKHCDNLLDSIQRGLVLKSTNFNVFHEVRFFFCAYRIKLGDLIMGRANHEYRFSSGTYGRLLISEISVAWNHQFQILAQDVLNKAQNSTQSVINRFYERLHQINQVIIECDDLGKKFRTDDPEIINMTREMLKTTTDRITELDAIVEQVKAAGKDYHAPESESNGWENRELYPIDNFDEERDPALYNIQGLKDSSPLKLLLVGDSGVGKSSLLLSFVEQKFSINFISTIGVDFKTRSITAGGESIRLQVWDTAGQERFRSLTTSFYRGKQAVLIVYDVTDKVSLESTQYWLNQTDSWADEGCGIFLVGTKADIKHDNHEYISAFLQNFRSPRPSVKHFMLHAQDYGRVEELFVKIVLELAFQAR